MSLSTFVQTANGEVGYTEGPNNDTKYGLWFGLNYQPWCSIFVAWCANEAGILTTAATASEPNVYKTASVQTLYNWYASNRRNLTPSTNPSSANYPKVGDLAFIDGTSNHVGIIVAVSSTSITTVEGNISDQVTKVTYSMSTLRNSNGNTISYLGSNNTHY
ncbi:CHAP domain-containing protein [Desulfoscipio gibsoniae]|uniref:CHAP domain-containing protein n=1 Tax=Desulfoscipio gibsoniae DSM 7213 TaxID=767817 RepID=R4KJE3_9FIRM|nr:CHAP domain-containing protein [Desulfoscipio gibsoniae]AGL03328.1 CHAP domain-containing protein [Desulfoscipio gibsoniae DSM 7213]